MSPHPRTQKRPITIFSILALVVLVIGGGATVLFSFFAVDQWMDSGEKFLVGRDASVIFREPGEQIVFFESPGPLPTELAAMNIFFENTETGAWLPVFPVELNPLEDYAPRRFLAATVHSGRPLWRVQVASPGTYRFRVDNYHEEQSADDRIVFGKNPASFRELRERINMIRFTLLGVTGLLVVGLYVVHAIALSKRRGAHAAKQGTAFEPMH